MRLLVFNAGSSSLKFDLIEVPQDSPGPDVRRIAAGSFVDAGAGSGQYVLRTTIPTQDAPAVRVNSLGDAAEAALDWLAGLPARLDGIDATVHRVVHGGERFRAPTMLNEPEIAALTALSSLAPLHNPPALAVIAAVRRRAGAAVPTIGVFDTAFYADLSAAAYRYAVPSRWHAEFGVRRYGFHGLAHRYMCQRACTRLNLAPTTARLVSLQLGRGCSVTASAGGKAVATSMGFTPLEGLVMGTRSGDIDAGAVLHMMQAGGLSAADMGRELNQHSGLLGLSGRSADMRELLEYASQGDADAGLAVEVFCRRARHYVAAYVAELGGVDAIVFGGGIGENAPEIRRRIVAGLAWSGVALDDAANALALGVDATISGGGSRAAVLTLNVDEASVIAAEASAMLDAQAAAARSAGDTKLNPR